MKNSKYAIVKLQEVIDDMSQALTSLAKSLNKTEKMIDVIKKSKQASEFKEDIEQMANAHSAKKKEYEALLAHRNRLNAFIKRYEASEQKEIIEETVLDLFVAFNVIKDEELED